MSKGGKKKSSSRTTTTTNIDERTSAVGDNRVLDGDGNIEGNLNLANVERVGNIDKSRTSIDNSVNYVTDFGAIETAEEIADDAFRLGESVTSESLRALTSLGDDAFDFANNASIRNERAITKVADDAFDFANSASIRSTTLAEKSIKEVARNSEATLDRQLDYSAGIFDDALDSVNATSKSLGTLAEKSIKEVARNSEAIVDRQLDYSLDVLDGASSLAKYGINTGAESLDDAIRFANNALETSNSAIEEALAFGGESLDKVSKGLGKLADKSESITRSDSAVTTNTAIVYLTYALVAVAGVTALYYAVKKGKS